MDVTDDNLLGAPPLLTGGVTLSARRWGGSTGSTTVAFDDIEVMVVNR
jgi:hypothetical protein